MNYDWTTTYWYSKNSNFVFFTYTPDTSRLLLRFFIVLTSIYIKRSRGRRQESFYRHMIMMYILYVSIIAYVSRRNSCLYAALVVDRIAGILFLSKTFASHGIFFASEFSIWQYKRNGSVERHVVLPAAPISNLFLVFFYFIFRTIHSKTCRYGTFELREFFFIFKTIIHRKTLDLYTCLRCYRRSVFEESCRTQTKII